ncbi:MAG: glycosyltransferase family 39 protein [Ideonella sp.]
MIIFVWLAASAWVRPLMLPDEGRYVGVAWEMLRSGDWLTPTLNGLPYFHKPPLFYWITASSLSIFGMNEWAARAAPLLGATLGGVTMFALVRRWSGEGAARATLVALLAQPLFLIGGQFANLDMLVAGCMTATIALVAHAALCAEHRLPYRGALAAGYAMAAAGLLAKGLIGFVLPVLVVGAWLLWRRQWRVLWAMCSLPGALLFFAIAAPWFVAMQSKFPDFLDYFFVVQHFKRFASGGFNNVQPFWFFPVLLFLFFSPWLPWLARLMRRDLLADEKRCALRLLLLLWLAIFVLFFSMPKSKLLGYILPAVAPLAALIAVSFVETDTASGRNRRRWLVTACLTSIISFGAIGWLAIQHPKSMRDFGRVMRSQHVPGQPVYMLGNYYFDLPFYSRLLSPVMIVDAWTSQDIAARDNWRKELFDAGKFAPLKASLVLIDQPALPASLCNAKSAWVLGAATSVTTYPFLASASMIQSGDGVMLWKVDTHAAEMSKALGCDGGRGLQ